MSLMVKKLQACGSASYLIIIIIINMDFADTELHAGSQLSFDHRKLHKITIGNLRFFRL